MSESRLTPAVRRVVGIAVAVIVAFVMWSLYDTNVHTQVNGRLGPIVTTPAPTPHRRPPRPPRRPRPRRRTPSPGSPLVPLADLPPEAADTVTAIDQGPPYPYDGDGVTFENREGHLPAHETGYYREFTVVTPGSEDRGARRIVAGHVGELYYTADHYDSFVRIAP